MAFCIETDTRDNVIARRNVLAGLWAGRLMQIPSPMIDDYAAAVHRADFAVHGDVDVLDKLHGDLIHSGLVMSRDDIRQKLCEFHREAVAQTRETD